jgi:mercuric ion transport protein
MNRIMKQSNQQKAPRVLAGGGFAAGLIALLASSCCALPIALAGLGMAGVAGAVIPTLAKIRTPLLIVSVFLTLAGWMFILRQRRACNVADGCSPQPQMPGFVLIALSLATGIVLLTLVWPAWIEPSAIRWLR